MAAAWRRSGLVKGIGLPAPSGPHAVGCIDLMHQFEGDENGALLVRFFYPAEIGSPPPTVPSQYAPWNSHKEYTKGYMNYMKSKTPGFLAALTNAFLSPRIPAVYGAPLLGAHPPGRPAAHSSSTGEGEVGNKRSAKGCDEGVNAKSKEVEEGVKTEADPSQEGVNAEANCSEEVNDQKKLDERDAGVKVDLPAQIELLSIPPILSSSPTYVPFPVVVFSHGLGAVRTTYSGICCDLASHGYVVASVEHRDRSACVTLQKVPCPGSTPEHPQFRDEWIEFYHRPETEKEFPLRNKQVLQRSREVRTALDLLMMLSEGVEVVNRMEGNFNFMQFQGKLDVVKAVTMGHSFGGATTIQALSEDQRFLCGLALDCWMLPIHSDLYSSGVQQPLLFINSFDFQWRENIERMMQFTRSPDENSMSRCRILTLRGTNHYNQTDLTFIVPLFVQKMTKSLSRLDTNIVHAINMDICHAFLRRYIHKDPSFLGPVPNLDGGDGHSEHILFGSNVDLSDPAETEQPNEASADGATGQSIPNEERVKSENDAIAVESEANDRKTKTTEEENTSAKEKEMSVKTNREEIEKDVKMEGEGEEKAEEGEEGQEAWKSALKEKYGADFDAKVEEKETLPSDDPTAKL